MLESVSSDSRKPYFELTFRPNVELISVVRRFVSSFYEQILSDPDATSRIALATHELLENATKYSTDGETTIRIEVTATCAAIRIRIWNRTHREHIGILRERFEEMVQSPDPFAYYQLLMGRTAKRRDGSGLGLARLRAEADMELSCEIEDDRVCIVADTHVEPKIARSPEEAR
jgi:anti-sigma regulatory factor (Ser/Thr protein kinase)